MGSPPCPWGCGRLHLSTLNFKSDEMLRRPDSRGDFYICYECKRHWPRAAVISKNTARDGIKPRGVGRL